MQDPQASGQAPVTLLPVSERSSKRVIAAGKLFSKDGAPFYLRGVTYGTFAPDAAGDPGCAQARLGRGDDGPAGARLIAR